MATPNPSGSLERVERHPRGLYLLFTTEMWERFSFYGMLGFLALYMEGELARGGLAWSKQTSGTIFGWYTGLVYLTPIIGGMLADRLLGTHRSMVLGGLIIAAGHFTLAAMDLVPHRSTAHIAIFFTGLALIIAGTGLFKPCVSVMVGQLYREHDPRRDAAFTIFYMGINLGAFLGPLICGTLRFAFASPRGTLGWSWAFGAAGVGMVLGLLVYLAGRPLLLRGIGNPPQHRGDLRPLAYLGGLCAVVAVVALIWYAHDRFASLIRVWNWLTSEGHRRALYAVGGALAAAAILAIVAFIARLPRKERGPVGVIFILAFFVIFFWTAFGQAGSSMNWFAKERTDRTIPPQWREAVRSFVHDPNAVITWWLLIAIGLALLAAWLLLRRRSTAGRALPGLVSAACLALGVLGIVLGALRPTGLLARLIPDRVFEMSEYPPDWFQSFNPLCILILAPIVARIWVRLGRRGLEPSTPVKFGMGLILLGCGFVFMVLAARASEGADGSVVRVGGWFLAATYTVNTMGELCLSPVGLSMVTKLAPTRLVSLLMGVWFTANFFANLLAGLLAGYSEHIASEGFILPGLAGFYLLFVIAPVTAGVVVLILSPLLKRMMGSHA